MSAKFRVSTTIADGEQDHQQFEHKIEAENAAAELARSGFFSTLWQRVAVAGEPCDHWSYVCDYAPSAGVPS